MDTIEQRAREIMAAIFDEDDMPTTAAHIRAGGDLRFTSVAMPLRAIAAALSARQEPTEAMIEAGRREAVESRNEIASARACRSWAAMEAARTAPPNEEKA